MLKLLLIFFIIFSLLSLLVLLEIRFFGGENNQSSESFLKGKTGTTLLIISCIFFGFISIISFVILIFNAYKENKNTQPQERRDKEISAENHAKQVSRKQPVTDDITHDGILEKLRIKLENLRLKAASICEIAENDKIKNKNKKEVLNKLNDEIKNIAKIMNEISGHDACYKKLIKNNLKLEKVMDYLYQKSHTEKNYEDFLSEWRILEIYKQEP